MIFSKLVLNRNQDFLKKVTKDVFKLLEAELKNAGKSNNSKDLTKNPPKIIISPKEIQPIQPLAPMSRSLRAGRVFLAGCSTIGLVSLVYYGLGLSNEDGILETSELWNDRVRKRIHSTYEYVGGGLLISSITAILTSRSKTIFKFVHTAPGRIISTFSVFASLVLVLALPYDDHQLKVYKEISWLVHVATFGCVLSSLTLLGGPLLIRAALYTASVIGGLSIIAITAPSNQFLNIGGMLSMGLFLITTISICDLYFQRIPTNYAISIYGGLVLFALYFLFDTQNIVEKAEKSENYDPIAESLNIYIDIISIFIRIAAILEEEKRKEAEQNKNKEGMENNETRE